MMIALIPGKKISFVILVRLILLFSSRPGRPPKRNSSHQIEDYSENKRLLLRSYPNHLFTPTLPDLYLLNNPQTTSSSKS